MSVRPKKHLGQHFLRDENIARKIVEALSIKKGDTLIEIGPGTGVLTKYLVEHSVAIHLIELDQESVEFLNKNFKDQKNLNVVHQDFLKPGVLDEISGQVKIIGNFPYNISSQIFFKVLDHRSKVTEIVCMLQKEVALRISSPPGNKQYGILSVLLQAFYDIEYLFTVKPGAFIPPPKVDSGVLRLVRNSKELDCNQKLFFRVVKQGFQNRRKTLRNALKPINLPPQINDLALLDHRAEQLSVTEFEFLTNQIELHWKT